MWRIYLQGVVNKMVKTFLQFVSKGSSLMDREFDIYFFLLAMNVETDINSWKWMYYTPDKTYLTFPGIFEGGEEIQNMKFHNPCLEQISPETRCDIESDCVAIIKTSNVTLPMYLPLLLLTILTWTH